MKTNTSARNLVLSALLASVALVVSYVESLFPLPLPIPGARIGLSNAVMLVAMLTLGKRAAFGVLAVKVCLSALLFGTPMSLMYASAGGLLAFGAMAMLNHCKQVSPIGQSIAGAVMHNLGQVLVAAALTATPSLFLYFTPLALLAILTGALSGTAAQFSARLLDSTRRRT